MMLTVLQALPTFREWLPDTVADLSRGKGENCGAPVTPLPTECSCMGHPPIYHSDASLLTVQDVQNK